MASRGLRWSTSPKVQHSRHCNVITLPPTLSFRRRFVICLVEWLGLVGWLAGSAITTARRPLVKDVADPSPWDLRSIPILASCRLVDICSAPPSLPPRRRWRRPRGLVAKSRRRDASGRWKVYRGLSHTRRHGHAPTSRHNNNNKQGRRSCSYSRGAEATFNLFFAIRGRPADAATQQRAG